MSIPFALGAVFVSMQFVRALGEREIRSGLFTYALVCGATAVGLWMVRRWGRALALFTIMGNVGIGTLGLASVIMAQQGTLVAPIVLLASGAVLGYFISRPVFSFPDE